MAKLDKELKKDAEFILDILGKDYNEWLNERHEEFIKLNQKKLREYAKKGWEQEKKLKENELKTEEKNISYNNYKEENNY